MSATVDPAISPGPTSTPIFHVHPLQRCNLACLHCYSESSPAASAQLSLSDLKHAVRSAADWGYRVLSVSGGEPLLYPELEALLEFGRHCGMYTGVVTNGLLVAKGASLSALHAADGVAVSVDGLSDVHDQVRGRHRAFDKVLAGLALLQREGIKFSISCGVTPLNILELDELAAAVHDAGAAALQLHPVENSGRAVASQAELVMSEQMATAFYVLGHALKVQYQGRMTVTLDAVHRTTVAANPRMLYGHPRPDHGPLANYLGVLVLDPRGNLMPVSYGFAREYWLGSLSDDLPRLARKYVQDRGARKLYALGQRVWQHIVGGQGPDVFNPSDVLARVSHVQGGTLAMSARVGRYLPAATLAQSEVPYQQAGRDSEIGSSDLGSGVSKPRSPDKSQDR